MKQNGQDPKELYEMACKLMEVGEALKSTAEALGYDEESDMEKISDEDQMENEDEYEKDNTHFVDQPTEGLKTYGERLEDDSGEQESQAESNSDSEEEDGKPIGKKAILISLKRFIK
jgi:hypothetical protein